MMFLGIDTELWSFHRRKVQVSDISEILDELHTSEGALVNALAYGSRGRYKLKQRDRVVLTELIDNLRNYIDHIEEVY